MMELHERANSVQSREDLVAFIAALRTDLETGDEIWENSDLPRFLEALEAWAMDLPGYFENRGEPVPEEPSWSLVAMLLVAAKHYE
jgi:hypothetical protein